MTPRVRQYAQEAATAHGVTVEAVLSASRVGPVYRARRDVMRRLAADGFSTGQIGRWMGRDHSTVIHSLRGFRP